VALEHGCAKGETGAAGKPNTSEKNSVEREAKITEGRLLDSREIRSEY
jgi:hypothetical protein